MDWLLVADWFLLTFHTVLIVFNLFGMWFDKFLRLNLAALILTGASWFILGIFYGIGYCPLTDLHWQILRELGIDNLPVSYVQYILNRLLGITVTPLQADVLTVAFYFGALMLSIYLNVSAGKKKTSGKA